MIPIKLTIQGLYSYQERQTIDFTKLTEANLFGIFGSVGSGKSTILEAITFALYGKTDRLNLSGDNRNYNMMNLKSNDLFIEFIFETGKQQTAYQAVVKGKRNGKKFEEVRALDRTAYRKEADDWIPIDPDSLEKAIGLSYDNFKRTIIIPQGQFQEFLQLGNKDRTQMMKELFNLERFELFYKINSLESKNNAQKQNVQGQLQQLGPIDNQQLKQHQEQLAQVEVEISQLGKTLGANQLKEGEWKQLQNLMGKMASIQQQLKQMKEREPEFAALEKAIHHYEQCQLHFKGLMDALNLSTQKISQKTIQIDQETSLLKKSEQEIALAETSFVELKTAYEGRDLLRQKAEELVKMARLNVLSAAVLADEDRIKNGLLFLDKTISKADELRKEKAKLDLFLKAEKAKLPDLAMLSRVKTWHVENNNLHQQLELSKLEIQKYETEISRINEAVIARFKDPVFSTLPPEANSTEAIQFLKLQVEQWKQQISDIEKEIAHYRVQAKLEEYAMNLHQGEACPLCGSLQHPAVFSAESMAEAMSKALQNKGNLEKQIAWAGENISKLSDLSMQLIFNSSHLKGLTAKQTELEAKQTSHTQLFKWEAFRDEANVNQAFALAETVQKSILENEENLARMAAQLEKELLNKEKFQVEIEKINTALTKSHTEIDTLTEQIHLVNRNDYRGKTSVEIEAEKLALLQKYAYLEKQFSTLSTQLNELRKTKDTLTGSLAANRKELSQEQLDNEKWQLQLLNKLEKAGYGTVDEVKNILALEMNLEVQKQILSDYRQQVVSLQSQELQLHKEIGDRCYDSDAHKKLIEEIDANLKDLNLKNQLCGKLVELIKKLKSDLESQAALQKTLGHLELRADNIRLIKSLFKTSGFVNYISSVYLQNLCNAANDRFFQLTRQKLSLEITEDNSFQVRDFLNGGKLRSVKTLSGGQTFQAALSLALALADNIQKITDSNQNFFFLDEGFGSLDKDALSVVFDTLKSLRRENRIVGVISHVEEMQQEIDTHLRIENHEETGSQILTSWN
ncbi:MAG TPA: SMC family ATPase [Prolixibacteraceae bacterium]|jgi:exonuclease SbcC